MERVYRIEIQAPIERVFHEISKTGEACRPMFDTILHYEPTPGAPLAYRSQDGKRTFIVGEVVEILPPRRFAHTFAFTGVPDAPTLVTWDLEEVEPGKTRVTVTHSRFPGETKTLKTVDGSWPNILGLFKSVLETGTIPLGARIKFGMMRAMSFMLPRATLTSVAEANRGSAGRK